jgi:hypothetical protein
MPTSDRGGLKAAFTNFSRRTPEAEAEVKLLGREVSSPPVETVPDAGSTTTATVQLSGSNPLPVSSNLVPKPLLQREPVRQLSFRCPVSLATELRRKAAFNQLEQQEIIAEGIRHVLQTLPDPPPGWEP